MILTGTGPGGSGIAVLARVNGNDGQPITQATISTIGWTVTDLTTGVIVATGTWVVNATIFQALQQQAQDPRWTLDTPARPGPDGLSGYNLLGVIPASAFPLGTPVPVTPGYPMPPPHTFQVDIALTPVAGQPFRVTGIYAPDSLVYG